MSISQSKISLVTQMTRVLYSLFLYILSPLIFLHFWHRGKKAPAYRKGIKQRLGFYHPSLQKHSLLIHCASVGEVLAAAPLIKQLKHENPTRIITVTCNTPTGKEQIKKTFGSQVQCVYLALDFPCAIKRMLKKLEPQAICILETELWPNLITISQQKAIPVVVINARLSEKSQQKYQRFRAITHLIMKNITALAAHDEQDAKRFIELGLDKAKTHRTGSIKFDIKLPQHFTEQQSQLAQQISNHSFIWVAGSTHPHEHEQIFLAHQQLLKKIPDALLIIAPRHPEQFSHVAELLTNAHCDFSQRSKEAHTSQSVLLADTMGEMLTLFSLCNVAYIGGSLIERGGHNPLEAAAFAKPILCGPSYYNFHHVYPNLIEQGACQIVKSADELSEQLIRLQKAPQQATEMGEAGKRVLQKNVGAIDKTINIINQYTKG